MPGVCPFPSRRPAGRTGASLGHKACRSSGGPARRQPPRPVRRPQGGRVFVECGLFLTRVCPERSYGPALSAAYLTAVPSLPWGESLSLPGSNVPAPSDSHGLSQTSYSGPCLPLSLRWGQGAGGGHSGAFAFTSSSAEPFQPSRDGRSDSSCVATWTSYAPALVVLSPKPHQRPSCGLPGVKRDNPGPLGHAPGDLVTCSEMSSKLMEAVALQPSRLDKATGRW